MNIFDIIDFARSEILDDTLKPYKWENKALLGHLNRAYEELCRESKCLIDSTTPAVCRVDLLSNQGMVALHPKIVYVYSARRQADGGKILPKTEEFMDTIIYNWQNVTGIPFFRIMNSQSRYLTLYPKYDSVGYVVGSSDINFVVATGPIYTIEKAGAVFSQHFLVGDSVVVTGTTLNNGTFTVLDVVSDTILKTTGALHAESGTNAILQKIRNVALLRVARLPLLQWTLAELESGTPPSPEIDEDYHMGLLDGIGKYAFRKQDTETYDPEKAKFHAGEFEDFKSKVAWEMASLSEGNTVCTPHYGAL